MHASQKQKRESVWGYPRPPRIEQSSRQIRVVFNDAIVAETNRAVRVLETSHPPVYYIPPGDVQQQLLSRAEQHSFYEFKGLETYYTLKVGGKIATNAAWSYHNPTGGYELVKGYIAFYPGSVDACYVDGERVQAQEGDFYGAG